MERDEILRKSRMEKSDEGMERAENKGRSMGVFVFCCVFIFIIIFNLFHGQQNYSASAMFWAFLAAEAYPKYQFTHNKAYLITVVAGGIASAASLLSFIFVSIR